MTVKLFDGVDVVIDDDKIKLWDSNPNKTWIWLQNSGVIEVDRQNKTVTIK